MKPAKRAYWPDEEPEKEYVVLSEEEGPRGCSWCGQDGHGYKLCPNRPVKE